MSTNPKFEAPIYIAVFPAESAPRFEPRLARIGAKLATPAQSPELALVDVAASDAARALKALHASKVCEGPFVLAVAHDPEQIRWALRQGADDFIFENASDDEFALRIDSLRAARIKCIEERRRDNELSALLDLTARYAASIDVAPLLSDLTRRLAEHMSVARCALVLLDDVHGQGRVVASSDDPSLVDLCLDLERYPEIQEAIRTCQPIVIDDVESHPLLGTFKDSVSSAGISAIAAIPLALQGKAFGVLLLRAKKGPFKGADISFAWTLAHATAIAVRNARTIESLRGENEQALDRLNQLTLYEEFFKYSSDGIVILDDGGIIVSLNPSGGEIFGMKPDDALGKALLELVTPAFRTPVREMIQAARCGHSFRNVDVEVSVRHGEILTLWVCCASIPGSDFAIFSLRDITAARADERSLRKSSEFMEKLIDASVDAIIAVSAKGNVLLFNKSAAKVFDHTASLRDHMLSDLFSDEIVTQVRSLFALNPNPESGDGIIGPMRTEVISRTGEHVPVLLTSTLIRENTQALAVVIIFSDLREKTRLEAALSRTEAQLAEAERKAVIAELAGTAAHQLNQPLTCIIGYTDLLLRRFEPDDENRLFIDRIRQEGERMADLVLKIGKISLYETKHYVGNSRIFDLERASGEAESETKLSGNSKR